MIAIYGAGAMGWILFMILITMIRLFSATVFQKKTLFIVTREITYGLLSREMKVRA